MIRAIRSAASGWFGQQVDAEGLVGARSRPWRSPSRSSSRVIVADGQDAQAAGRRRWPRSAGPPTPSPCRSARSGSSTPNSSRGRRGQRRMRAAARPAGSRGSRLGDLGEAQPLGVESLDLLEPRSGVGQSGLGHVVGDHQLEPRRLDAPRRRSPRGAPTPAACGRRRLARGRRSRTHPGWTPRGGSRGTATPPGPARPRGRSRCRTRRRRPRRTPGSSGSAPSSWWCG